MLVNAGFHSSGNQVLYNGMTGDQIYSDIYIGPTYYMRLKHMVKDKINYRALGPRTVLTRQTVQGRANDGGLRIGEMERDGVLAHGASAFLNESFMIRGDEYYMAVCNKTGCIAVYNNSLNLFLSPFADGPIKFNTTLDGKLNIQNISRFGRDFSIVRVPYALKLLIHELQTMNIQMRIITEDNVDQIMNMSYSDNISKLLKTGDHKYLSSILYNKYRDVISKQKESANKTYTYKSLLGKETSSTNTNSSVPYAEASPAYEPEIGEKYNDTDSYNPNTPPNRYSIHSPDEPPPLNFRPHSPDEPPPPNYEPHSPDEPPPLRGLKIKNQELKTEFDALPEQDKLLLMKMVAEKKSKKNQQAEEKEGQSGGGQNINQIIMNPFSSSSDSSSSEDDTISILKVEEDKTDPENNNNDNDNDNSSTNMQTKSVRFDTDDKETSSSGSGETKKITL